MEIALEQSVTPVDMKLLKEPSPLGRLAATWRDGRL
jgi:hypothetical protein